MISKQECIAFHEAGHFVIGELSGLTAQSLSLSEPAGVTWLKRELVSNLRAGLSAIAAGEAANERQFREAGVSPQDSTTYIRAGSSLDKLSVFQLLCGTTFEHRADSLYDLGLEEARLKVADDGVWEMIKKVKTRVRAAIDAEEKELDVSSLRLIVH